MYVSSLEINISFFLMMMSFAFLLRLMTPKQPVFHGKGLFWYSMATTGYYLLTTILLMWNFLSLFVWATWMSFFMMMLLLVGITVMLVIMSMFVIVMLVTVSVATGFFYWSFCAVRTSLWNLGQGYMVSCTRFSMMMVILLLVLLWIQMVSMMIVWTAMVTTIGVTMQDI